MTKVELFNTAKLSQLKLMDLKYIVETIITSGGLHESMEIGESKVKHLQGLKLSIKIHRVDIDSFEIIVLDRYEIKLEVIS